MNRFTYFPAADFREMWTQNVNQRRREFIGNRISKYLGKGAVFPENLIIGSLLGHTCGAHAAALANLSIAATFGIARSFACRRLQRL